jgi:hypothetical protein
MDEEAVPLKDGVFPIYGGNLNERRKGANKTI